VPVATLSLVRGSRLAETVLFLLVVIVCAAALCRASVVVPDEIAEARPLTGLTTQRLTDYKA
jgi:hypothetical protein